MTFLQQLNQEYFQGALSPAVLDLMDSVNEERPEVQEWVERMFRQMRVQRFDARDFNEVKAWVVGSFLAKILPGAWDGSVPPITLTGRHAAVDDYMESNQWSPLKPGERFLDLGCGFPPMTTIDSSARFPDVHITGADPSFARYLVRDGNGDYACFDSDTSLLYFQPGSNEPDRYEALFGAPEATSARFRNHLLAVIDQLPKDEATLSSVEHEGMSVAANPVLEFVSENLSFDQRGIGSDGLGKFHMARCFNVLCYFDRSFRDQAIQWVAGVLEEGGIFLTGMNWAKSRHARYAVNQAVGGGMVAREYAFAVENIRPLELISWFALHDDDYSTAAQAELVGAIRADEAFRGDFDGRMDELLADTGFTSREEDGYLGTFDPTAAPETLDSAAEVVGKALEREGFAERAAEVLRAAGYEAWINCVGHIAVDPEGLDG